MSWWIVTTSPAQERRAVAGLGEAGFLAWCPMRLVRFKSRHMRVASEREYPVFPGYAFVDHMLWGEADAWHAIGAIEEVRSILTNAGRPLVLGDLEFERVRAHLDALASRPVDADVWRKDDLARVTDGPFMGFEGVISRGERRGSVELLLSLFGRQTAAEISVDQLERAA